MGEIFNLLNVSDAKKGLVCSNYAIMAFGEKVQETSVDRVRVMDAILEDQKTIIEAQVSFGSSEIQDKYVRCIFNKSGNLWNMNSCVEINKPLWYKE